jgi:serine protease Do
MIRIMIALLLVGSGIPATSAGQPEQNTPKAPSAPPAAAAPQATTPAPAPAVPGNVWYSSQGRSYLGVDIQDVTAERVGPLKLKEERGVEVTMVDQDAPAGKAGIKEHDVIVEFNGTAVESEEQLRRMIREVPPGRTITLGLSRDGNPMKISVQLGDRGKIFTEGRTVVKPRVMIPRVEIPKIEIPGYAFQLQMPVPLLGVQTENLGPQLAKYFGVKEGVLIRSVEKGSAAEKAGLAAGDVIIRADNEKVTDRSDLAHVLHNHPEGGKMTLTIVRREREQAVVVDLPKRGSGDSWRIIDSDEINILRDDLEDLMNEVGPEVRRTQEIAALKLRGETERLHNEMQRMKPEVEKSLRESQSELHRIQKMLKEELKKQLESMI